MVIFNSYVKLPEGIPNLFPFSSHFFSPEGPSTQQGFGIRCFNRCLAAKQMETKYAQLDVLVNNAAIAVKVPRHGTWP
jgi:hypothetical protein